MAEVTADYNGYNDMREEEREGLSNWEESDDDLAQDDVASWRGEAASVHPPLEDVPGKTYPGKDETLEHEGDGHGGEDGS